MNNKRVINSNTTFLKIIAIISMTLYHIGIIFFPNIIFFRIIGRMSFPLFAYCTASGCIFTKNIKKYILRLFVLGFISQPIYIWAFDLNLNDIIYSPNILFTLAYGAVVICFLQNKQYIYCLFLVIASLFVNLDYGVMGIGLIILFYVFREKRLFLLIVCGCYLASEFIGSLNIQIGNIYINAQGFSVLSIPIIAKEVAFKPRINKYFFYLYYPLHLLLLGIIWHIAN